MSLRVTTPPTTEIDYCTDQT